MNKATLKLYKENYEKACNAWINELLNMWEQSPEYGFWVGDEVGGTYFHEAGFSFDMSDIIFCVENNVPLEKVWDFIDYTTKCSEYNFNMPNLKSYVKGCPTVPDETFEKLDSIKAELEKCINDTKNKF